MDRYLIDYLRSGEAWVFVGSGPSNAMGYPSWSDLAKAAVRYCESVGPVDNTLRDLLEKSPPNYPEVFQRVGKIVTMPVLLRELRAVMKAYTPEDSEIYNIIASWPVPVYLTTNFDDQIQTSLVSVGEAYIPYGNSAEHMALLNERLSGAVMKLHGDLRSNTGLVLTTDQYKSIVVGPEFEYWRKRMEAIMQMRPMVIVGHSLSDPNIKHVLKIAKHASGVERPICWIADDSNESLSRKYLNDYRIRVIGYSNTTGKHEGLLPLLRTVSRFVPPRSSVVIADRAIMEREPSRAATALHVFNRLGECAGDAVDRIRVLIAAVAGGYRPLKKMEPFTLDDALLALGWPDSVYRNKEFSKALETALIKERLFQKSPEGLRTTVAGDVLVEEQQAEYQHVLQRFTSSVQLRIRGCPVFGSLRADDVSALPGAIERALSQYFEKAGVSFASMLRDDRASEVPLPKGILEHVRDASTQFDDFRARLVFCSVTLDMFCEPRTAEKEYLGRISEGFFAFHSLGVFGEVGNERRRQLGDTVWLLDSNVLVHLLSNGYLPGLGTRRCGAWLVEQGIRLFTIDSLFEELRRHLVFAFRIVSEYGEESSDVMAAALGNSPYKRSNAFLHGFLETKAEGKCGTWESYCMSTIGSAANLPKALRGRLNELGVEVLHFSDWPGFEMIRNYGQQREYEDRIVKRILGTRYEEVDDATVSVGLHRDPHEKAKPEAEALVIVEGERSGALDILERKGEGSAAWFVSDTSVLNAVFEGGNATWQSVSFERHVGSFMHCQGAEDVAFSSIVESIAQSGYTVIGKEALEKAFSHLIDESSLSISQERAMLDENLGNKYSESVESVLNRLAPIDRPLAAAQLKSEALQEETRRREAADELRRKAEKKLSNAERELESVDKYVRKQAAKREQKAKLQRRKQKSGGKNTKKKHKR